MVAVIFDKVRKAFGRSSPSVGSTSPSRRASSSRLLGPSGCGKTTTLRMLAGLELPTSGRDPIGDRVVNDLRRATRDIAMVFQSYALYPHMTVAQNIAYPLRKRGVPKAERAAKVTGRRRAAAARAAARPQAAPALRRPAAARRAGPRAGARPAGVPARRAAVEPRRQAARPHARRADRAAPRGWARRWSTSPTTSSRR